MPSRLLWNVSGPEERKAVSCRESVLFRKNGDENILGMEKSLDNTGRKRWFEADMFLSFLSQDCRMDAWRIYSAEHLS